MKNYFPQKILTDFYQSTYKNVLTSKKYVKNIQTTGYNGARTVNTTHYFQVAFTFWLLRYVFTLVVFILGIKAPGIRQEYNSRIPIPDEEAPQVS